VDACYALAAVVFGLGFVRDYLVDVAMREQPSFELRVLDVVPAHSFAQCLVIVGTLLVLSSFYRLGVTGTAVLILCVYLNDLQERTWATTLESSWRSE